MFYIHFLSGLCSIDFVVRQLIRPHAVTIHTNLNAHSYTRNRLDMAGESIMAAYTVVAIADFHYNIEGSRKIQIGSTYKMVTT